MKTKTETPVDQINDFGTPINPKLKAALNKFFKENPHMAEGCIIRRDWDGRPYTLIIEGSLLYEELNFGVSEGALIMFEEFGVKPETWKVHTAFHKAFIGTGWFPEPVNSCVIGFYKD